MPDARRACKGPRFAALYPDALAIAEAQDRVPFPSFLNGQLYNFWQDSAHVRGIWGRSGRSQHARKFATRMSAMGLPNLFYEVVEGGHGAGANLKDRAHTSALEFTYLAQRLMGALP